MPRESTPREPGAVPRNAERPDDGSRPESPDRSRNLPPGRRLRPPADPSERDPIFGRWGDLPEKEQEFLLNPASDQLPVRYRRYIEEYFKKVRRPAPR